jgi:hypothetical protein
MIAIRPLPIEVKVICSSVSIKLKQYTINLLGSSETSARTGAVYVLHELALEEDKYRQQIVQILCSHVRSKTSETEYQKTHKERQCANAKNAS